MPGVDAVEPRRRGGAAVRADRAARRRRCAALAAADVAALAVREPSLEEIFLAYYGEAPDDRRDDAVAAAPPAPRAVRSPGLPPGRSGAARSSSPRCAAGMSALVVGHLPQRDRPTRPPPRWPRWPRNPAIRTLFGEPRRARRPGRVHGVAHRHRASRSWSECGDARRPPGSPAARRTPAAGTCCWPAGCRCAEVVARHLARPGRVAPLLAGAAAGGGAGGRRHRTAGRGAARRRRRP